jgi:myosin heavy subunit
MQIIQFHRSNDEKLCDAWVDVSTSSDRVAKYVKGKCNSNDLTSADLLRASKGSAIDIEDDEQKTARVVLVNEHDSNAGEDEFIYVPLTKIFNANDSALIESSEDLTNLLFLEEPNVLNSLRYRFQSDLIYTSISGVIIAINPYKETTLYSSENMMLYQESLQKKRPPHIYSICEEAFMKLNERESDSCNQTIIICGESGSGKTENAKHIMRYLSNRSRVLDTGNSIEQVSKIEGRILHLNYILESFGNASTVLNHNSSRFGKFTKLYFRETKHHEKVARKALQVVGASTEIYLLEKSRVVLQSEEERNFHVFYILFHAISLIEREALHLAEYSSNDFRYLSRGGVSDNDSYYEKQVMHDKQLFKGLKDGFESFGFGFDFQISIFSIVSAILHLGNVTFLNDQGPNSKCKVEQDSACHFKYSAELLGLDLDDFLKVMVTQKIRLPKECIEKNASVSEAALMRDSISKSLYEALFTWIVRKINSSLEEDIKLPWVGILDVFGFEALKSNSFEQLLINYANECLQQYFNRTILASNQQEYINESILWNPIVIPDCQETIDVIGKVWTGILSLIDSACRLSTSTPDFLLDTIFKTHQNSRLIQSADRKRNARLSSQKNLFLLKHYAGDVIYEANEFLVKNRDRADPEILNLIQSSSKHIVSSLFDSEIDSGLKNSSAITSISKVFSRQLKTLVETLEVTNNFFVKCIKPNLVCSPLLFDQSHVCVQLRCNGIVQAVKILKGGFSIRIPMDTIFMNYRNLIDISVLDVQNCNRVHFCRAVLALFGFHHSDYVIGSSKIFIRHNSRNEIFQMINYNKALSTDEIQVIVRHMHRLKWKLLIYGIKASCTLFHKIRKIRSLEKFFRLSNFFRLFCKTFGRLLKKNRSKHAIISCQCFLKSFLEAQRVKNYLLERDVNNNQADLAKHCNENTVARPKMNARSFKLCKNASYGTFLSNEDVSRFYFICAHRALTDESRQFIAANVMIVC